MISLSIYIKIINIIIMSFPITQPRKPLYFLHFRAMMFFRVGSFSLVTFYHFHLFVIQWGYTPTDGVSDYVSSVKISSSYIKRPG